MEHPRFWFTFFFISGKVPTLRQGFDQLFSFKPWLLTYSFVIIFWKRVIDNYLLGKLLSPCNLPPSSPRPDMISRLVLAPTRVIIYLARLLHNLEWKPLRPHHITSPHLITKREIFQEPQCPQSASGTLRSLTPWGRAMRPSWPVTMIWRLAKQIEINEMKVIN